MTAAASSPTAASPLPVRPSGRSLALALVFAGQLAVLGWMISARAQLLRTGQEIVLDVTPVDPRDLFRGDYVSLGYPAQRIPAALFAAAPAQGATVYAVLAKTEAGVWQPVRVVMERPRQLAASEVAIKSKVGWSGAKTPTNVDFGIGSYFIPENEGRSIEKQVADHKVQVRVSVGRDGTAAIKALLINGTPVYTEPFL